MDKTLKLVKPILRDGEAIKTLEFDFENLGSDANIVATRTLQKANYHVVNPLSDIELMAIIGGMAAGLEPEEAFKMHVKDKIAVAAEALNFFNEGSEA